MFGLFPVFLFYVFSSLYLLGASLFPPFSIWALLSLCFLSPSDLKAEYLLLASPG